MPSAVKLGDVELLPGEIPLKSWDVGYMRRWFVVSNERLHLTTERLIFARGPWFWPWRPHRPAQETIPLRDIRECSRGTWFPQSVVRMRLHDGTELRLRPYWFTRPEKIADTINEVRRERGLYDG